MTNSYQLSDYPFAANFIELEDGNMHYLDEGQGPVLLFVHGSRTWSYSFRKLINNLKCDYRCIALDMMGMGLSDKDKRADYSMAAHSRRLDEFVNRLNLTEVGLVLQEWGGPIALNWAVDHKDSVSHLIILNSFLSAPFTGSVAASQTSSVAKLQLASARIPILGSLIASSTHYFLSSLLPTTDKLDEPQQKSLLLNYSYPQRKPQQHSRGASKPILTLLNSFPLSDNDDNQRLLRGIRDKMAGWPIPALLLWGAEDTICSIDQAGLLCRLLPALNRPRKFNGAGHLVQEYYPEEISQEISDFLANNPNSASEYRSA